MVRPGTLSAYIGQQCWADFWEHELSALGYQISQPPVISPAVQAG